MVKPETGKILNVTIDVRSAFGFHGDRGIGRVLQGLIKTLQKVDVHNRYVFIKTDKELKHLGKRMGVAFDRVELQFGIDRLFKKLPPFRLGIYPLVKKLLSSKGGKKIIPVRETKSKSDGPYPDRDGSSIFIATDFTTYPSSRGAKLVGFLYDVIPLIFPREYGDIARAFSKNCEKLRYYDGVITISEASKKDICAHLIIEPEKIFVMYPSVDDSIFNDAPPSLNLRKEYGLSDRYVMCVGAGDYRKNLNNLLIAYEAVMLKYRDSIRFVFVGTNSFTQGKLLQDSAIRQNAVPTGFIDDFKLANFYKKADLLVFPSLYEGFGLPILEAMKCGCPVLACDNSSIPEVAGSAAVMCDPRDPKDIANKVIMILEDSRLRKAMIEKGKIQASKFNWNHSANSFIRALQTISGQKSECAYALRDGIRET